MGITYDGIPAENWFKELESQNDWNVRHFLTAAALLGMPKSMLDVGCGTGAVVRVARWLGVKACGVDQLIDPENNVNNFHWNLVDYFALDEPVNLVWCLEVAEHLDPSAHATLCDSLSDNLIEERGNYLVFSAAFPNQGGMGHVSERPSKYWQDQFSLRKLNYRKDLTVGLALLWSNIGSPLYWLASNVMVFEK